MKRDLTTLVIITALLPAVVLAAGDASKRAASPLAAPTMVQIAPSSFAMGHPYGTTGSQRKNEAPQQDVDLPGFAIMRDEVTVGQWVEFLEKVGGWMAWHRLQPVNFAGGHFGAAVAVDEPIRGVDWAAARAFCRWHGLDLPSEAQWERAARGTQEGIVLYPWGDTNPTCGHANLNDGLAACAPGPRPVGSHADGASSEGVNDLSGNVAEWVRDWYGRYKAGYQDNPKGPETGVYRVIRGGGYVSKSNRALTTSRDYARPKTRSPELGFRCAKGP